MLPPGLLLALVLFAIVVVLFAYEDEWLDALDAPAGDNLWTDTIRSFQTIASALAAAVTLANAKRAIWHAAIVAMLRRNSKRPP